MHHVMLTLWFGHCFFLPPPILSPPMFGRSECVASRGNGGKGLPGSSSLLLAHAGDRSGLRRLGRQSVDSSLDSSHSRKHLGASRKLAQQVCFFPLLAVLVFYLWGVSPLSDCGAFRDSDPPPADYGGATHSAT
ncbi:UNVERIFIED_CONTAM: hypothetical protein K2H54_053318 [Gekko kuhli]